MVLHHSMRWNHGKMLACFDVLHKKRVCWGSNSCLLACSVNHDIWSTTRCGWNMQQMPCQGANNNDELMVVLKMHSKFIDRPIQWHQQRLWENVNATHSILCSTDATEHPSQWICFVHVKDTTMENWNSIDYAAGFGGANRTSCRPENGGKKTFSSSLRALLSRRRRNDATTCLFAKMLHSHNVIITSCKYYDVFTVHSWYYLAILFFHRSHNWIHWCVYVCCNLFGHVHASMAFNVCQIMSVLVLLSVLPCPLFCLSFVLL